MFHITFWLVFNNINWLLCNLKPNLKKEKKTLNTSVVTNENIILLWRRNVYIDTNCQFFAVGRFSGSSQTKQFEFRDMHTGFLYSVRSTDVVAKWIGQGVFIGEFQSCRSSRPDTLYCEWRYVSLRHGVFCN